MANKKTRNAKTTAQDKAQVRSAVAKKMDPKIVDELFGELKATENREQFVDKFVEYLRNLPKAKN